MMRINVRRLSGRSHVRGLFVNGIPVLVSVLLCSLALMAEAGPPSERQQGNAETATGQFDPRDLSGIWDRKEGDMGVSPDVPPMTPEGLARLDANRPGARHKIGRGAEGRGTPWPCESRRARVFKRSHDAVQSSGFSTTLFPAAPCRIRPS